MGKAIKFVTPELRLSYCHLFEPHTMPGSDKAKYSVSILVPKSDKKTVKLIQDAIQKAVDENQDKLKTKKALKLPLRDGDEARDSVEYEGHYFLSVSSKDKPIILDEEKQVVINTRDIYSGMYGRVSFNFFAFDTAGNKGIGCGLNAVQKTADGEPLGPAYTESDAADDFGGAVASKEEDDDFL